MKWHEKKQQRIPFHRGVAVVVSQKSLELLSFFNLDFSSISKLLVWIFKSRNVYSNCWNYSAFPTKMDFDTFVCEVIKIKQFAADKLFQGRIVN